MVKYKVTVDRDACLACGIAPNLCPKVFVLGEDDGKNRVVDEYTESISEDLSVGLISEELYDCVKEAAEACPVQAITIDKIS